MPINRGALGAIAAYSEDQRKRREEAYKQDRDFQNRIAAAGIVAGRLQPIIQGGRVTGVQPATTTPFDPASLKPGQSYSQRMGAGTLTSRGQPAPRPPTPIDPHAQLQRELSAQNALQEIEQRNALGATMAMAERETAFPRPSWGGIAGPGYIETKPNLVQSMTGTRQRPYASAVPMVDTTPYRNRLTQLQSGRAAMAPLAPSSAAPEADPIAQRIQQLLQQGVDRGTIAQHLRDKGVDPSQYGL